MFLFMWPCNMSLVVILTKYVVNLTIPCDNCMSNKQNFVKCVVFLRSMWFGHFIQIFTKYLQFEHVTLNICFIFKKPIIVSKYWDLELDKHMHQQYVNCVGRTHELHMYLDVRYYSIHAFSIYLYTHVCFRITSKNRSLCFASFLSIIFEIY